MTLLGSCSATLRTVGLRPAAGPTQCPACEHPRAAVWERLAYTGRLSRQRAAQCVAGSDDDTGWGPPCGCTDDFHAARSRRVHAEPHDDGSSETAVEPAIQDDRIGRPLADIAARRSTASA